jgi:hypothetical protein
MYRYERAFRIAEVVFSGSALAISIAAFILTTRQTMQNQEATSQAIALARQANDIALGRTQEYPRVHARGPDSFEILRTGSLPAAELFVSVENRGTLPVAAVQVALQGVSGLTYATGDYRQVDAERFVELRETVQFSEQLTPGTGVDVDILGMVLRYLRSLELRLTPGVQYTSVLQVRVLAQTEVDDLPVRSPDQTDEIRLSVVFTPEALDSAETRMLLAAKRSAPRFYPGAPPRVQPSGY